MPIFMDRHDLSGATATNVADAHRKDLEIQDRYGVKFLTYWFDEGRGTAFCLVEAPDKETAQRVHHDAHGHVAGDIIEVALSTVEAFLGRISDPQPRSDARDASCLVRAYAEDHTVVGDVSFEPKDGTNDVTIRTERLATSVERIGCTAEGQNNAR